MPTYKKNSKRESVFSGFIQRVIHFYLSTFLVIIFWLIPSTAVGFQAGEGEVNSILYILSFVSVFLLILVFVLVLLLLNTKKTGEALRESELQGLETLSEFERIYVDVPVGLGLIDTDLRYIQINDFLINLHGGDESDHLGRKISEVLPGIGDVIESLCCKVMESGTAVIDYEVCGNESCGSIDFCWLMSVLPWNSSTGNMLGVSMFVIDISGRKHCEQELINYKNNLEDTVKRRMSELIEINNKLQLEIKERKSAEIALYESEKLYRTLIEKANDAVFLLEAQGDDVGKIISANDAAAQMHGYNFDELLTLNIKELDTPETAAEAEGRFQQILAGEWIIGEITHKKKDGTVFPVEISAGLLDFGEKKYILAFDRDITERKKVEYDLIQSQKSEAMGTLAGGIAHDFNNILGTIIGYAEMVEIFDLKEDSPAREKVQEVIRAAYRAKKLVEQILTFSRRVKYERVPVLLDPLINEVLGFIKAILPPNITVQYNVKYKSALVMADSTQIHQILMNLCTNAMHAMRTTGGMVNITLDKQCVKGISSLMLDLEPGDYVKLIVSDSGEGMDLETMERVFDPYFTTKEKGEGTGMGLSVVQGIVKNYDGSIIAESGEGVGSVFQVFLPSVSDEKLHEKELSVLKISVGKGTILFVDDEPTHVDLSKDVLEKCGYTVIATTSSEKALAYFEKEPDLFDLVITDQVMPKLKGGDLARKILAIRPDIPIVLCTGFSGSINEDVAREIGIRDYLFKPVGAVNLIKVVGKILDVKTTNSK